MSYIYGWSTCACGFPVASIDQTNSLYGHEIIVNGFFARVDLRGNLDVFFLLQYSSSFVFVVATFFFASN